ncbi:hypothetical protein DFJ63DRAFT_235292 [Scheffersomyces coipomensis]|uniref:uncharacterized protein n=1 Tax=Scheffersomyces coipomensis TaxID=1788519 RepID=UPI00315D5A4A
MSSGKPTTPLSSPKLQQTTRSSVRPSTPPLLSTTGTSGSGSDKRTNRNSAQYLRTPEQSSEGSVPFSPSLKRTNSGNYKSPDYKLNHQNISSPYNASNLLKTPRHTGYDSDDNSSSRRTKLQKTPQFFSSAKKLFQGGEDGSPNKEDLSEISSQLKSKLSSALGKIQRDESNKISFTELNFDSESSPTKKSKPVNEPSTFSPSKSLQRANLNLQTLQQSPLPKTSNSNTTSPYLLQGSQFSPLKQSPILHNENNDRPNLINLPSPDEESSAHNALLAALSRQRRKSRSSFSHKRRPSIVNSIDEPIHSSPLIIQQHQQPSQISSQPPIQSTPPPSHTNHPQPVKLPPLNIVLAGATGTDEQFQSTTAGPTDSEKHYEQDAILSLMSLSSPQAHKFGHSRNHSLNNNNIINSPVSSRSSSVIVQSPGPVYTQPVQPPVPILPPLSRMVGNEKKRIKNKHQIHDNDAIDSDATDIDEDADVTDDDNS